MEFSDWMAWLCHVCHIQSAGLCFCSLIAWWAEQTNTRTLLFYIHSGLVHQWRDLISFNKICNSEYKMKIACYSIVARRIEVSFWLNTVCYASTSVPIVVINWIQLFIFPCLVFKMWFSFVAVLVDCLLYFSIEALRSSFLRSIPSIRISFNSLLFMFLRGNLIVKKSNCHFKYCQSLNHAAI